MEHMVDKRRSLLGLALGLVVGGVIANPGAGVALGIALGAALGASEDPVRSCLRRGAGSATR